MSVLTRPHRQHRPSSHPSTHNVESVARADAAVDTPTPTVVSSNTGKYTHCCRHQRNLQHRHHFQQQPSHHSNTSTNSTSIGSSSSTINTRSKRGSTQHKRRRQIVKLRQPEAWDELTSSISLGSQRLHSSIYTLFPSKNKGTSSTHTFHSAPSGRARKDVATPRRRHEIHPRPNRCCAAHR
jgi:hypothetical protein